VRGDERRADAGKTHRRRVVSVRVEGIKESAITMAAVQPSADRVRGCCRGLHHGANTVTSNVQFTRSMSNGWGVGRSRPISRGCVRRNRRDSRTLIGVFSVMEGIQSCSRPRPLPYGRGSDGGGRSGDILLFLKLTLIIGILVVRPLPYVRGSVGAGAL